MFAMRVLAMRALCASLFLMLLMASVRSALAAGASDGAGPSVAEPTEVLILGVYHFHAPGEDAVQPDVEDVLRAERQEEILEVVDSLLRFEPDRVAVELPPERAGYVDSLYTAYLDDRHELERPEWQQLGFRIAAASGHDRLYPIDHRMDAGFQELTTYARENDLVFFDYFQDWVAAHEDRMNEMQQEATIPEILRWMNDPEVLLAGEEPYARMGEVGEPSNFVGADVLAAWYQRNARTFAQLAWASEPGDRVLVIIGAGHAPILRDLVEASTRMQLADPLAYL